MKHLMTTAAALAGALWLCTASAGYRRDLPLVISGSLATGAVGQVRNDSQPANGIFCSLRGCPTTAACSANSFPAGVSVECSASTASATLECTSTSPNLISVVQMISPDSSLVFSSSKVGSGGNCTMISVANGSPYEPPSAYP